MIFDSETTIPIIVQYENVPVDEGIPEHIDVCEVTVVDEHNNPIQTMRDLKEYIMRTNPMALLKEARDDYADC